MATFPERPIGSMTIALNSTVNFKLDRVAAYRYLILRFVVNLTTGATAPTYLEDALLKFIKNVKITRNGSDVKFSVSGRTMYLAEKIEKGTTPQKVDPTSSTTTTANATVQLIVDFASNRDNEKDVSALLIAKTLSQLDLDITFGDATTLASANAPTINLGSSTSFVTIEAKEVIGDIITTDGKQVDVLDSNPIDIYSIERTVPLDNAAHVSFDGDSQKENVTPAPSNILQNLFIVTDNNNAKSDAIITSLKIQREVGSPVRVIEKSYSVAHEETKNRYKQESLDVGVVFWDYLDKLAVGLINNGNEGDVKYRFLKASSTSANLVLLTRYVPSA